MKFCSTMLLLAAAMALVGCNTDVNCPALNDAMLAWTPYEQTDTILFANRATNDSVALTFRTVQVKHTAQYNTGTDCGQKCENQIVATGFFGAHKLDFFIKLEKEKVSYQSFTLNNTYFTSNYGYAELQRYSFDSVEYENARVFTNSDSTTLYRQLVLAQNFGVVGMVDSSNNVWSMVTTPPAAIDSASLTLPSKKVSVVNITGC
ncbi:MAG: hypothetical protein LBU92_06565 [Prevotellaceae bacterium]|nr:hypothetical protein [Prevotellaceae bacterium]